MPLIVSIARVSDIPEQGPNSEFATAHQKAFGAFSAVPKILRDPEDPNQVAVVGQVHDVEGLRAASRTPEGDAVMRQFGFLEQLSYFLEDA